jgi:hypothetical protein
MAVPASVTVRVEGAQKTLVPLTAVTTNLAPVDKTAQGGSTCSGTSAGGALQLATGGDWGGGLDAGGDQTVERIFTESYPLGTAFAGRRWAAYINDAPVPQGLCDSELVTDDHVLFFPLCAGAATSCFSEGPLDLSTPAIAKPGVPFTVTVREATIDYGLAPAFAPITTKRPSAGATLTVTGVPGTTTTDAVGNATITLPTRGLALMLVTKGGHVRDEAAVCVTDGTDHACVAPTPAQPMPAPAPACQTNGHDGFCGTLDRTPPNTVIRDIGEQQSYPDGEGPGELRADVTNPEPAGFVAVKMRLTRDNGSCQYFSGTTRRFMANRGHRCGAQNGYWFKVGDSASAHYTLPSRLGPGRYVLDVNAIDKAFNRDDQRVRTRNRVVFRVL